MARTLYFAVCVCVLIYVCKYAQVWVLPNDMKGAFVTSNIWLRLENLRLKKVE